MWRVLGDGGEGREGARGTGVVGRGCGRKRAPRTAIGVLIVAGSEGVITSPWWGLRTVGGDRPDQKKRNVTAGRPTR